MTETGRHTWQTREMSELFDAMLSLETKDEVESFLRDLCTLAELEAMAHRWTVARLVDQGLPSLEVAEKARASTTTVTREAHSLGDGEAGYPPATGRLHGARSTLWTSAYHA